jgi:histidyl-tRNA synthetase
MSFRTIRGTFDVLPEASTSDGSAIPGSPAWVYVESVLRSLLGRFNFEEIRTPILEDTELIARGIGNDTDIVSKEMFVVERGDNSYVLRPEITAPVMRSYLQHSLDQRGGVQKLFYVGPCFRAENPQKGRYRQFHQFGCEIIGSDDARVDAELIALMTHVYEVFGIENTRLRINSLGDAETRPRFREALVAYLEPFRNDLTETSRQRLETNPLRILDTKNERERAMIADAPRMSEFLSVEARHHYELVRRYLEEIGVSFVEDPLLVRGLDYYSRTAFELESSDLGAQSALAGGGRYDGLATEIGARQTVPAAGFAAGIERLFLALSAAGVALPVRTNPEVFLVALGEEAAQWAFRCSFDLRKQGVHVATDLKGRSMKAQMREANRQNATTVVIAGKDELDAGQVVVKDMATGSQRQVQIDALSDDLIGNLRSQTIEN